MSRSSRKIAQTFNGRVEWIVPGGFFKLLSSVTGVDVELWHQGQQVLVAENVDAGWYQPIEFDRVIITTPVSQEVEWMYSPSGGGSDRLAGDVSVIDGAKARTLAGIAFLGQVGCAAGGAVLSHVQLLNPAGSGVRVVLRQIIATLAAADGISFRRYDTALTTLGGNAPSKNIGGATSLAELRSQTNAVPLGTGNNLAHMYVQANVTPPPIVLAEPIVLVPGRGLIANLTVNNITMGCTFEFIEEPDV